MSYRRRAPYCAVFPVFLLAALPIAALLAAPFVLFGVWGWAVMPPLAIILILIVSLVSANSERRRMYTKARRQIALEDAKRELRRRGR